MGNDDFLSVCLLVEPSLAGTVGAEALLHSSGVVAALQLGTVSFLVGVPLVLSLFLLDWKAIRRVGGWQGGREGENKTKRREGG